MWSSDRSALRLEVASVFSIFALFGSRRPSSARAASARRRLGKSSGPRYFRPCVEGFEDRVVPAAPVFNAAHVAHAAQAAAATSNIVINSVQLTNFQIVDNVLQATGTVSGTLA